jgi:protein-tyrosine phosphatase
VTDESPPLPNSYWLESGRILCGQYPGGRDEVETQERLRVLFGNGINCFIDLTESGEREPYERYLTTLRSSAPVEYRRMPIPDHGLPQSLGHMQDILNELDRALAAGRRIYLHCRAGIGRTNLVAGCWLVNRGFSGEGALAQLNERWQSCSRSGAWPSVPETEAQCDFVREWRPGHVEGHAAAADSRDRVRGMLLGLAAAEAQSHAAHGLPAGAWADKTAMTLCLADSFIACGGSERDEGNLRRRPRSTDRSRACSRQPRPGHRSDVGNGEGDERALQGNVARRPCGETIRHGGAGGVLVV